MLLVWFRNDLRTHDHEALAKAIEIARETRQQVVGIFVFSDEVAGRWGHGGASKWWLHHSLLSLSAALKTFGIPLILRKGAFLEEVPKLVQELKARHLFMGRRYIQSDILIDQKIMKACESIGCEVESFNLNLLVEPWTIKNLTGTPYKVYTPFWNKVFSEMKKNSLREECEPKFFKRKVSLEIGSKTLEQLNLLPKISWDSEFYEFWKPGEEQALKRVKIFVNGRIKDYNEQRNIPSVDGTSLMSPHLAFGEISPRRLWNSIATGRENQFLKEVVWREFAYQLLYHFPETDRRPLRKEFENFPWEEDKDKIKKYLRAWQTGMTGYPIVDAGMRQLWKTGWMHNRVRMIVASFLVKDLFIPWQKGAEWFWDTLVDADLANNTLGWQWTAGCGADAAPYFRIFNPVSQGEKFDANGDYIRRWIPELSQLPNKWIHRPAEANQEILASAKITLGKTYPHPIVDHNHQRFKALRSYDAIKS